MSIATARNCQCFVIQQTPVNANPKEPCNFVRIIKNSEFAYGGRFFVCLFVFALRTLQKNKSVVHLNHGVCLDRVRLNENLPYSFVSSIFFMFETLKSKISTSETQ